jgi:peroxiredoxin
MEIWRDIAPSPSTASGGSISPGTGMARAINKIIHAIHDYRPHLVSLPFCNPARFSFKLSSFHTLPEIPPSFCSLHTRHFSSHLPTCDSSISISASQRFSISAFTPSLSANHVKSLKLNSADARKMIA